MSPFGSSCSAALALALSLAGAPPVLAQGPGDASAIRERITRLIPEFETYLQSGMKDFKVPGVAVGIVHDDKLIYAKGFGVRERGKPDQVSPNTIFQIGSTTKAFLSTTLAQAVDSGKLSWSARVSDLMPEFQLSDPWIGREFRVLDLAAQRGGFTPYVNDALSLLGYDRATLIHSLRDAPITATFRSDFTYVNIPHIVAGEILARKAGVSSWSEVVKANILDPLGMSSTTATPEAIEKAPDHATGHRTTKADPVAIPFHASFPYAFGPAGALNSNIPDMAQWLRMQLGRGQFEDRFIVSEKNLDVTWTPRVAISERTAYAVGWVVNATPNGRIIWHNGGTSGFGAHAGFVPDRDLGIVILSNLENTGLPDAAAQWFYDRVMGNDAVDNVALALEAMRAKQEEERQKEARAKRVFPPQDLSSFAGNYASSIIGDATVQLAATKLQIKLEETDATLTLEQLDTDTFNARLDPTGPFAPVVALGGDDPVTQVRFERDDSGAIKRMRWLAPSLPHVLERQP
ncbi:serine hydrolase [Microvirga alba]|uniref:Serine hydrolase n=1 Tax=Microvirga alba TaxID=2791025 RepID=A0A931BPA0_9HYPH|nr:serine hydrolase [Microvirga alba]MBF9233169.1 serine hydrolase [Microvirga alba]